MKNAVGLGKLNVTEFKTMNERELSEVEGGIFPILIAGGALFVSSAALGYKFGSDLASRKNEKIKG